MEDHDNRAVILLLSSDVKIHHSSLIPQTKFRAASSEAEDAPRLGVCGIFYGYCGYILLYREREK